jgi:hypothetical protein
MAGVVLVMCNRYKFQSPCFKIGPRGILHVFLYHARRLRLEKYRYLELSRSASGYFRSLLDPGGSFRSETTVT